MGDKTLITMSGGCLGGLLGMITVSGIVSCVFYSALGATVGYFMKMGWDFLLKKLK